MTVAMNTTESFVTNTSRPIDRLPIRKTVNEQKQAMNCKSCRKRKIKCNRLKPRCEACQVFNCPCIYDATPKKRGPKTDVLEALLKRVNGLERRLKDEQKSTSLEEQEQQEQSASSAEEQTYHGAKVDKSESPSIPSPPVPSSVEGPRAEIGRVRSNPIPIEPAPTHDQDAFAFVDALLDTYFARIHNKPYYILDEAATRMRLRDGRLPRFLINAIHAVSLRYVPHLCGGHQAAMRSSHDYAVRSRAEISVDEPSIDNLQALLLLTMASFQNGKGKRCYMFLTHAVSMAFALNLHRELPSELRIANSEREGRRKLFWTCYLMDRFTVSGSKRPCLVADESIHLRLPGWLAPGTQTWSEGNYFPRGSGPPYASGITNTAQGSSNMLVEIVRILGVTNRYLSDGGVKGDSHFPWHARSTLSRIRSDLDYWAAATQDIFTSVDTLFGSHESSTLVLSKLIYHLVHCLIYRPFLPVDLSDLSGGGNGGHGQSYQSWQIEATNLCFLHANAIAELVEIGKNTGSRELPDWPSFVGYCICTAGTIHVHGAHYHDTAAGGGDAFCHSAEFLSREMAQLGDLSLLWAGVQHQRETLQAVYASHDQLVKSLAQNPVRFSHMFQNEDFFERYPGAWIDAACVSFDDVVVDWNNMYENGGRGFDIFQQQQQRQQQQQQEQQQQQLPHQGGSGEEQYMPPPSGAGFAEQMTLLSSQQQHQQPYYAPSTAFPKSKAKNKRRSTTSSLPYPTPKADYSSSSVHNTIEQGGFLDDMPQFDNSGGRGNGVTNLELPGIGDVGRGEQNAMLFQGGTLTPNFAFSPVPSAFGVNTMTQHQNGVDDGGGMGECGSVDEQRSHGESDPFLSLLEQLGENDASGLGVHHDFDFL